MPRLIRPTGGWGEYQSKPDNGRASLIRPTGDVVYKWFYRLYYQSMAGVGQCAMGK